MVQIDVVQRGVQRGVQTGVQRGVQIRVQRVDQQDAQRDGELGVLRGVLKDVLRADRTGDPKWVWITVLTEAQRVGSIRRKGEGQSGPDRSPESCPESRLYKKEGR